MRISLLVLQFLFLPIVFGFSLVAVLAFLGFANPLLDALNHFQPLIFSGTLGSLLVVLPLYKNHVWRSSILALVSTGFLASAVIVIPETLSSWLARPAVTDQGATIKLMSRNLFGLNREMDKVAAAIANEDPDIIAFQEYFDEQWRQLHGLIVQDYPYFSRCAGGRRAFVAIYSKWPFELVSGSACPLNVLPGSNDLGRLVAAFDLGEQSKFTIVTTQLNWPIQISPLFNTSLELGKRISGTWARQQEEFSNLAQDVRAIQGPVILVGDFNSTPWSFALRRFASRSGLERQTRNMATFPTTFFLGSWVPTPPFLPIDHIMSTAQIVVSSVKTGEATGSDHLALITEFSVLQEN